MSDYENSISIIIYHLGQSHFKFHNMTKYSLLGLRAILKWKCTFSVYRVALNNARLLELPTPFPTNLYHEMEKINKYAMYSTISSRNKL